MLLSKFSFIVFIISLFCANVFASFSDMDCLKSDFSTSIVHKAAPFGLLSKKLSIKKEKCVLTIEHEKFKYIKNKWIVDVCRSPIHIKSDSGSVEVVKRVGECRFGDKGDFCSLLGKIESLIQDDGLIFAEGSKEDLNTSHGKVHCASLLVDSHLRTGLVFDWTSNYTRVLKRKSFKEERVKKIEAASGENQKELVPAEF